jgi:hypothetical protein
MIIHKLIIFIYGIIFSFCMIQLMNIKFNIYNLLLFFSIYIIFIWEKYNFFNILFKPVNYNKTLKIFKSVSSDEYSLLNLFNLPKFSLDLYSTFTLTASPYNVSHDKWTWQNITHVNRILPMIYLVFIFFYLHDYKTSFIILFILSFLLGILLLKSKIDLIINDNNEVSFDKYIPVIETDITIICGIYLIWYSICFFQNSSIFV